jgi:hypothetical protein
MLVGGILEHPRRVSERAGFAWAEGGGLLVELANLEREEGLEVS